VDAKSKRHFTLDTSQYSYFNGSFVGDIIG